MKSRYFIVCGVVNTRHISVAFGYDKYPPLRRIKEIIELYVNSNYGSVITNIIELTEEDYKSYTDQPIVGVFNDNTNLSSIIKGG